MQPKNTELFLSKSKELIDEIDNIVANQSLRDKYSVFGQVKNDFRSKAIAFLRFSFEDPNNEFKEKFENNFHEVEQLYLFMSDKWITGEAMKIDLQQFQLAKSHLTQFMNSVSFVESMNCEMPASKNQAGLFFKGQYFDAIFGLSKIIEKASAKIYLVDNYINEDLLNFLALKNTNVSVSIITSGKNIQKVKLLVNAYNMQHGNLEVKVDHTFHDRFLIIDDSECYHFGASLKDLGSKSFMYSQISQQDIKIALINNFESVWKNALPM